MEDVIELKNNTIEKMEDIVKKYKINLPNEILENVKFYFYNKEKIKIYTNKETSYFLLERFNYLFNKSSSSQSYFKPPLEMHIIDYFEELIINNVFINTIKQNHGRSKHKKCKGQQAEPNNCLPLVPLLCFHILSDQPFI